MIRFIYLDLVGVLLHFDAKTMVRTIATITGANPEQVRTILLGGGDVQRQYEIMKWGAFQPKTSIRLLGSKRAGISVWSNWRGRMAMP